MIKIAICEDNAFEAKGLHKQVQRYFNNRRKDAEIKIFHSGAKLMEAHSNRKCFDFYFLDISLGSHIEGLDLGKTLRKYFPSVNIVYVTGYSNHHADAIHIHAFDYLVKPIKDKMIKKLFDDYYDSLDDYNKPFIIINNNYKQKRLVQDHILYITKKVQQNQIVYHTTFEDISEYGSLKTALKKLDVIFAQANRKTVINLRRVKHMDKENCYMDNACKIPIGRSFSTELRKKFRVISLED